MNDLDPRYIVLIVGTVLAFFLWLVVRIGTYDRRRQRGLEALAPLIGFTYQAKDNGLLGGLERYRMFPSGSNPWITNVLTGWIDHAEARLLDYSWHAGTGRSSSYNVHSVVVLRSSGLALPYFAVDRAVPGLHRLASALESHGVLPTPDGARAGFPEDPAFSKAFVVRGDPAALRTLLDEEVRRHLMRFAGELVGLEGHRDTMLFTRWRTVTPEGVRAFLEEAAAVYRLLAARASPR